MTAKRVLNSLGARAPLDDKHHLYRLNHLATLGLADNLERLLARELYVVWEHLAVPEKEISLC